MFPITHHHVQPTDPKATDGAERRHEIYRMMGRILLDLTAFAIVAATLWWIMVKV